MSKLQRSPKMMVAAEMLKQFYDELIHAGFSKDEAIELTKDVMKNKNG